MSERVRFRTCPTFFNIISLANTVAQGTDLSVKYLFHRKMKVIASRNDRATLHVESERMENNCGIPYWIFGLGRDCPFSQKEIKKNRNADKNIYCRRNYVQTCRQRFKIHERRLM